MVKLGHIDREGYAHGVAHTIICERQHHEAACAAHAVAVYGLRLYLMDGCADGVRTYASISPRGHVLACRARHYELRCHVLAALPCLYGGGLGVGGGYESAIVGVEHERRTRHHEVYGIGAGVTGVSLVSLDVSRVCPCRYASHPQVAVSREVSVARLHLPYPPVPIGSTEVLRYGWCCGKRTVCRTLVGGEVGTAVHKHIVVNVSLVGADSRIVGIVRRTLALDGNARSVVAVRSVAYHGQVVHRQLLVVEHHPHVQSRDVVGRGYLRQRDACAGLYQGLARSVDGGIPLDAGVRHRLHLAAGALAYGKGNVAGRAALGLLVTHKAHRGRHHLVHYHDRVDDVVGRALEELVVVGIEPYLYGREQSRDRKPLVGVGYLRAALVITARAVGCAHLVVHRDGRSRVRGIVLRRGLQLDDVAVTLPAYLVARLHYHVVGQRCIGFASVLLRLVAVEYAACHLRSSVIGSPALLRAEDVRQRVRASGGSDGEQYVAPFEQCTVIGQHGIGIHGYVLCVALELLHVGQYHIVVQLAVIEHFLPYTHHQSPVVAVLKVGGGLSRLDVEGLAQCHHAHVPPVGGLRGAVIGCGEALVGYHVLALRIVDVCHLGYLASCIAEERCPPAVAHLPYLGLRGKKLGACREVVDIEVALAVRAHIQVEALRPHNGAVGFGGVSVVYAVDHNTTKEGGILFEAHFALHGLRLVRSGLVQVVLQYGLQRGRVGIYIARSQRIVGHGGLACLAGIGCLVGSVGTRGMVCLGGAVGLQCVVGLGGYERLRRAAAASCATAQCTGRGLGLGYHLNLYHTLISP